MSKAFSALQLLPWLGLVLLLTAASCGQQVPTPEPRVLTFVSNPSSLPFEGGDLTLSWTVENAKFVIIDQGIGPVSGNSVVVKNLTAAKTFTLTASDGNKNVTAKLEVGLSPQTEFYVDPVNGSDAALGSKTVPLKTLKKALELVKPSQTIVLFAGDFDQASGETWNYTVPDNVIIKANSSGVKLASLTAGVYGLRFAGSALIQFLEFKDFNQALTVEKAGKVRLLGLKVSVSPTLKAQQPYGLRQTTGEVELESSSFSGPMRSAIFANAYQSKEPRPKLKVSTTAFEGIDQESISVINGDINISGGSFKNSRFGLYLSDNSNGEVRGASFGPNLEGGIETRGKNNQLKVRGSQFDSISTAVFADDDYLGLDLGKTGDLGFNSFSNITSYVLWTDNSDFTAVRFVYAQGNTWLAGVQGADSNGKYINANMGCYTNTGPPTGKNYRLDIYAGKPALCFQP